MLIILFKLNNSRGFKKLIQFVFTEVQLGSFGTTEKKTTKTTKQQGWYLCARQPPGGFHEVHARSGLLHYFSELDATSFLC